jgi:hypothetical protein
VPVVLTSTTGETTIGSKPLPSTAATPSCAKMGELPPGEFVHRFRSYSPPLNVPLKASVYQTSPFGVTTAVG